MILIESTVEYAAHGCFRELAYAVMPGPQPATWELTSERDSFSDVVLLGRLREAIRQFNPVITLRPIPTLRSTLLKELMSVAHLRTSGDITQ